MCLIQNMGSLFSLPTTVEVLVCFLRHCFSSCAAVQPEQNVVVWIWVEFKYLCHPDLP